MNEKEFNKRWPELKKSNHKAMRQNLHNLCKYIQHNVKNMVEIGSLTGISTLIFANYFDVVTIDPYLPGYDPNDGKSDEETLKKAEIAFIKNTQHIENIRQIKETSEKGSFLYDDNSIDFVYIDGCHTYQCVTNDIQLWLPKVTKWIGGHDYPKLGVKRAVLKLGNPELFEDGSWLIEKTQISF
jgi:hypothetical protein